MKYAIVESGGKQYKAVEGATLEVDRLQVNPGDKLKLEQVLLLADGEDVMVGAPVVKGSPVWTSVLGHFKGEKVTIFNYSPKKRIRTKTGHRQNYTRLLVEQVGGSELVKKVAKPVEKPVEKKVEKPAPRKKVEEKPAKAEPKTPVKVEKKTPTAPAAKAKAAPVKATTTVKKPAKPAAKPATAKAPAKKK
jgi:large subunit ribosomal protein L21